MAKISMDVNRECNVTIISIKGVLEKEDLPNALAEYFSNDPTLNTIYDSTEGDWSAHPTEYYMEMIRASKGYGRKGSRTAMVFSNPVDFGIGRMVESHCELEGYANELACFHSLQDAKHWVSQANS